MAENTVRISTTFGNRRFRSVAWRWAVPALLIAAALMAWYALADQAWAEPVDDAVEGSTEIVLVVQEATPGDPDNPSGPDNPDNPDNPSGPDNPSDPDNPSNPDNPDNPSNPETDPTDPNAPAKTVESARADLEKVIADAQKAVEQGGKPAAEVERLKDAIAAAQQVAGNPDATVTDLEEALAALESAKREYDKSPSVAGVSANDKTVRTGDTLPIAPIVVVALAAAAVTVYARYRRKSGGAKPVDGLFVGAVVLVAAGSIAIPQALSDNAYGGEADDERGLMAYTVDLVSAQANSAEGLIESDASLKISMSAAQGTTYLLAGTNNLVIKNNTDYYMRLSKVHVVPDEGFAIGTSDDNAILQFSPANEESVQLDGATTVVPGGIDPSASNTNASAWFAPGVKSAGKNELVLNVSAQSADLEAGEYPLAMVEWAMEPVVYSGLGVTVPSAPVVGYPVTATVANAPSDPGNVLAYEWRYSDDGGQTWLPIPGATERTFTPTEDLKNKKISVAVSCENPAWYEVAPAVCELPSDVLAPEEGTFVVMFDLNGHGTTPPDAQFVSAGSLVEAPMFAPMATGYIFNGWYKDADCTQPFSFATDRINADTVLYAKWTEMVGEPYEVRHFLQNADDDEYSLAMMETLFGLPGDETQATAKPFTGFAAKPFAQAIVSEGNTPRIDIYYDRETVQVLFDVNGHGRAPAPQAVRYGGTANDPGDLEATGYEFVGWFTSADGDAPFSFEAAITEPVTAYAHWGKARLTVNFDTLGALDEADAPRSQVVEYGAMAENPGDLSVDGLTFDGWYSDTLLTQKWDFAAPVQRDMTLYAGFSIHVVFDMQGHGDPIAPQAIRPGGVAQQPDDPSETGYIFQGWFAEGSATAWDFGSVVVRDTTLIARWEPISYVLRFEANGGEGSMDVRTLSFEEETTLANQFARDGYTFTHWNTESDDSGTSYLVGGESGEYAYSKLASENGATVTLYAQWAENDKVRAVRFDANGRDNAQNMPATQKVADGDVLARPEDPTADGYSFEGWYKDDSCERAWNFGEDKVTQDTTLYARWAENPVPDDPGEPEEPQVATYTVEHYIQNLGDDDYVLADTSTIAGIAGEDTQARAKGYDGFTPFDFAQQEIAADGSTIIAIYYARNLVTLTYAGDHGMVPPAQNVRYGTLVSQPASPQVGDKSADGYKFAGWFTDEGMTLSQDFPFEIIGDTTLYMKWEERNDVPYRIEHYRQNLALDDYEIASDGVEQHEDGVAGRMTGAQARDYDGFTALAIADKPIAADGSTVVSVYYKRHVVTPLFNANGGAGIMPAGDAVTYDEDAEGAALPPNEFTRPGYVFTGWNTEPDGSGVPLAPDANAAEVAALLDGPVTLYPQWEPRQLRVSFVMNGHGDQVQPALVGFGESVDEPIPAPTAEGYVFNGWYADEGLTEGFIFHNSAITDDTTLYAKWVEEPQADKRYTVRHWVEVPADAPAPQGAETRTHLTKLFYLEDEETLAATEDGKTNAGPKGYEGYEALPFEQRAVVEGGDTVIDVYYVCVDVPYSVVHLFETVNGTGYLDDPAYAENNKVGKPGALTQAQPVDVVGFEPVLPIDQKVIAANGSTVVEVKYNRMKHAVTFDMGGVGENVASQQVRHGGLAERPADPAAEGRVFDGWFRNEERTLPWAFDVDAVTSDTVLYAKWADAADPRPETAPYTVNHYLQLVDGDSLVGATEHGGAYYRLDFSDTTGMGVIGENTQATPRAYGGFEALDVEQQHIAADGSTIVDVYYNRAEIEISYDMGDHGDPVASQKVAYGTAVQQPSSPALGESTDDGYRFAGWYADPELTQRQPFPFTAVADVTVYACWQERDDIPYTIEHYQQSRDLTDYVLAEAVTLEDGVAGAMTNAWPNEYPGFTALAFENKAVDPTGTTVVRIDYKRHVVEPSFDANGGDGAMPACDPVVYDPDAIGPALPENQFMRPGYKFTGWNTEPDGSGTALGPDAKAADVAAALDGPVTLYPQWEEATYTVSFQMNNEGAGQISPIEGIYYGETIALKRPVDPTAAGFAFAGWYADAGLTQGFSFTTTPIVEDTTLYAKWVEMPDDPAGEYDGRYAVNHWLEIPAGFEAPAGKPVETYQGKRFYLEEVEPAMGTPGAQTAAVPKQYAGYDYLEYGQESIWLNAPTTVNIYYVLLADVPYTVKHLFQVVSGTGYVENVSMREQLTGTTGAMTVAQAKDVAGFEAVTPIADQRIAGNGSTVVEVKYDRVKHGVTFNMNGFGEPVEAQQVRDGALVSRPADPSEDGKVFGGWHRDAELTKPWAFDADIVTADVELHAKWVDAPQPEDGEAAYTVNHYLQLLDSDSTAGAVEHDGSYYALDFADTTGVGVVGSYTQAQVRGYTGFTPQLPIQQETIAADGTTVVNVFYDRGAVTVTYDANGHGTAPQPVTVAQGTAIASPAEPAEAGWVFQGWSLDDKGVSLQAFPFAATSDITLYAKWAPATFTATFSMNGHGAQVRPQQNIPYGGYVARPSDPVDSSGQYVFGGWYRDDSFDRAFSFTTDSVTSDVTLHARWVSRTGTQYTVRHMQQRLNGAYELAESEPAFGLAGEYTNAASKNYEGYTLESIGRAIIREDGTTTVEVRYSLSGNTRYVVRHMLQDPEGSTYTEAGDSPERRAGTTSALTQASANTYPFFTSPSPVEVAAAQKPIAGDGSTEVVLYYPRQKHTVAFDMMGHGAAIDPQQVRHGGSAQRPADPVDQDYAFQGWFKDRDCTVPFSFDNEVVSSDVVLYALWGENGVDPNDPEVDPQNVAAYTVNHYLQVADEGNPPAQAVEHDGKHYVLDNAQSPLFGVIGRAPSQAVALSYPGFEAQSFSAGRVQADGSTVVDIYYDRTQIRVSYELHGHGNAGDPAYASQLVPYGIQIQRPDQPEATGWLFQGWFTAATGGSQVTFPVAATQAMTLHARWAGDPNTPYQVVHQQQNLQLNGYDVKETEELNGTTGEPAAAVAKSYVGFTALPFDEEAISANGDTRVVISYDRNVVNISFDANGGTGEMSPVVVKYDPSTIAPALPVNAFTNVGSAFQGWNTEPDGSGDAIVPDATAAEIAASRTGDVTLYAQWEFNGYTVRFDLNGHGDPADPAYAAQVHDAGDLVTPVVDPVDPRGEYAFNGWYRDSACTQAFSIAGDPVTRNLTLYAKWTLRNSTPDDPGAQDPEAVSYTVEHYQMLPNQAGWRLADTDQGNFGVPGMMTQASAKSYQGYTAREIEQKTIVGPDGATVVQVFYDANADTSYTVKHLKLADDGSAYQEDVSMRQQLRGETGAMTRAAAHDFGEGYIVQAFDQQPIAGDGSTVITIKYDRRAHEVDYVMNGHGEQIDPQRVLYGAKAAEPDAPSDEGYAFNGWFTDPGLTRAYSFATETVTSDITLYALWTQEGVESDPEDPGNPATGDDVVAYQVRHYLQVEDETNPPVDASLHDAKHYVLDRTQTFYAKPNAMTTKATALEYAGYHAESPDPVPVSAEGDTVVDIYYDRAEYKVAFHGNGHGNTPADIEASYGTMVRQPIPQFEAGYVFGGWYTDDGTFAHAQAFPFALTDNVDLFAQWTLADDTKYTVEHHIQNIALDEYEADDALTEEKRGTTGEQTQAEASPAYATGFRAQAIAQQPIAADGSTVIQVRYDRNSVNATFDANGGYDSSLDGRGAVRPLTLTYGVSLSWMPACTYVNTGHVFTGWNTKADGTGDMFQPGVSASAVAADMTGDVTFYAQWDAVQYPVRFHVGDHGAPVDDQAVAYGGYVQRPADPIDSEGTYVFDGWFSDPGLTRAWSFANDPVIEETDLYAKWVAAEDGPSGEGPDDEKVAYHVNHMLQKSDGTYQFDIRTTEYGLPGTLTAAEPRTYAGFEALPVQQQTIAANGSTVVEIRYDRTANTNYTVKHLLQNASGNGYTEDVPSRQRVAGVTGALTAAAPNAYEGFEAPGSDEVAAAQRVIAGDGSTVVELRYKRQVHEVTFAMHGQGEGPDAQAVRHGATVTRPVPAPTAEGYVFEGWYADDSFTRAWSFGTDTVGADTVLHAHWVAVPSDPVAYTVRHHQESYEQPGSYLLVEEERVQGERGSRAKAIDKGYGGFALSKFAVDGDETAYAVGVSLETDKVLGADEDIVIDVYYDRNPYTVTIDYNGHGNGSDPQKTTSEFRFAHVLRLPVPAEQGYTFNGWHIGTADGPLQASPLYVTGDVELVAQWVPHADTPYRVRHMKESLGMNGQGEYDYEVADVDALTGTTGEPTAAAAKDLSGGYAGFAFAGTSADGDGAIVQKAIQADGTTVVDLYYTRASHAVTFDMRGHDTDPAAQPAAQTVRHGGLAADASGLVVGALSADGCRFGGWFSDPSCSAGTEFRFAAPITADTVVYAKWTQVTHKVTYDYGEHGQASTITANHFSTLVEPQSAVVGYTFEGWYTDAEFTNQWNFQTDRVLEDVVLHGKWSPNNDTPYKVEHYKQNVNDDGYALADTDAGLTGQTGAVTSDVAVKNYVGFAIPDEEAVESAKRVIAADGSTVVRLFYDRNEHDVTFNSNGGSEVLPAKLEGVRYEATIAAPTEPTLYNHTFDGWYLGTGVDAAKWDFDTSTMPDADIELMARWTENTYTVTFVTFVEATVPAQEGKKLGEKATEPAEPSGPATFEGWYTDTDYALEHKYDFGTPITGNLTLYAKWSPEVVFHMGGLAEDIGIASKLNAQILPSGSSPTTPEQGDFAAPAPTVPGYDFAGWYTDSGLTVRQDFPTNVSGDMHFYAKWSPHSYTVLFDGNGAAGAMGGISMTYGTPRNLPACTFRNQGYVFAGWAESADGEAVYANEEEVCDLVAENGGTKKLYTTWKPAEDTPYKVRHLLQNLSQDGYDLAPDGVDDLIGVTGNPISPAPRSFDGFTLESVEDKAIAANGSTVVDVKYNRNAYPVVYDANGHGALTDAHAATTALYGAKLANPGDLAEYGYVFDGWCTDPANEFTRWNFDTSTVPANNLTLSAKWNLARFKVTLHKDGHGDDDVTYREYQTSVVQPETPSDAGYTFGGWYADAGFADEQAFPIPVTGDVDVYEKWRANAYTIAFDLNGGTVAEGAEAPVSISTAYDAQPVELPNDGDGNGGKAFERAGYDFAGWNTAADGSGTSYAADAPVSNLTQSDGVTVMLFAKWTPRDDTPYTVRHFYEGADGTFPDDPGQDNIDEGNVGTTGQSTAAHARVTEGFTARAIAQKPIAGDGTTVVDVYYDRNPYAVTFDLNGKGSSVEATAKYGTLLAQPGVSAPGFILEGWYKERACVNEWNLDEEAMPSHALTLYAKWRPGTFNVTLNMGGVIDDVTSVEQGGTSYVRPVSPTATGYTFGGWFSDAGLTEEQAWPIEIVGNTTVYAKWTPKTYEVRFSKNTSSAVTGSTETLSGIGYDADFAMSDCGWEAAGYVFQEWNTAPDGSGDAYKPGLKYAGLADGGFIRLYAQWAPADGTKYKVVHYLETVDGSAYAPTDEEERTGVTESPTEATPNAYPHFTCVGTDQDGDGAIAQKPIAGAGDTEVAIYYKRETYAVSFDGNGVAFDQAPDPSSYADVRYEATIARPTDPEAAGYEFQGWYTSSDCATAWDFGSNGLQGDTTLYAKWQPKQVGFTVETYWQTLNGEGQPNGYELHETDASGAGFAGDTPAVVPPTYDGFTLRGDYDLPAIAGNGTTVVKLYYDRNQHGVTFDANGHGAAPEGYAAVSFGARVAPPSQPEGVLGYDFGGWFKDAACANEWTFATDAMPDSDLVLYAKWTPKSYTLTYVASGGDYADAPTTSERTTFGQTIGQPVDPTATGYTFDRWYSDEERTTMQRFPFQVEDDKTVYGKWTANPYTIAFDANGGVGEVDDVAATYGQDAQLPANEGALSRLGYAFGGWNENAAGTGTTYGSGEADGAAVVRNLSAQAGAVVKLYAKWVGNPYAISLQPNGAEGEPVSVSAVFGTGAQLPANGFVNPGYDFAGWNTQADGSGESFDNSAVINNLTAQANEEVPLFAQWNPATVGYKVEHYRQNVQGTGYEWYETDASRTGVVGEPTEAAANSYDGFTAIEPIQQETIAVDPAAPGNVGNTVVKVYYDRDLYSVSYVSNGRGISPDGYAVRYGDKVIEEEQEKIGGWKFDGWFDNPSFTGSAWNFDEDTMPARDLVLYAKWTETTYAVTFDVGDHAAAGDFSVSGKRYRETVAKPSDPAAAEGYKFEGWYDDPDFLAETEFPITVTDDVTVYANWEPISYTVKFDGNGRDGETYDRGAIPDAAYFYGDIVVVPACAFEFDGYEFTSWNTEADGTGTTYEPGQADVKNLSTDDGGEVTLYAQWNPVDVTYYIVHMQENPGDDYDYTEVKRIEKTGKAGEWTDISGVEYERDYIGYDQSTGKLVDFKPHDDEIQPQIIDRHGTTVVAVKYDRLRYTLELLWNSNSSNYWVEFPWYKKAVKVGASVPKPDFEPTPLEGKGVFKAWYEYYSDKEFNFETGKMPDENLILYPELDQTEYPLYVQCGSKRAEEGRYQVGTPIYRSWCDAEAKGTDPDGYYFEKGEIYLDPEYTEQMPESMLITGPTTVYVKYIPNTYTIKFGSYEPSFEGSTESITAKYDEVITLPDCGFTKQGYAFECWKSYEGNYKTKYYPGDKVAVSDLVDPLYSDALMEAFWVEGVVNYTISNNLEAADGTWGSDIRKIIKTGKTGEVPVVTPLAEYEGFVTPSQSEVNRALSGETIAEDGSTVIHLEYSRKTYDVEFNYNNASAGSNQVYDKITKASRDVRYGGTIPEPYEPSIDSWYFDGWYADQACTTAWDFAADVANDAVATDDKITLYAKWLRERIVTFDMMGHGRGISDKSVRDGYTVEEPPEPTASGDSEATGYEFGGWYADDALTAAWDFNAPVTGDMTLHAKWVPTYTVTFVSADPDVEMPAAQAGLHAGERVSNPGSLAVPGYTFGGWYKDAEYTELWNFATDTVVGNTKIYAQLLPLQYNIEYDLTRAAAEHGGDNHPATVNYGETFTVDNPTCPGYTFQGWKITGMDASTHVIGNERTNAASANGVTATAFKNLRTNNATTVTFKAVWKANTYTVDFQGYGNKTMDDVTMTYDTEARLPSCPYTSTTATFIGWSRTSGSSEAEFADRALVKNLTTVPNGTVRLYPVWKNKSYTMVFNLYGGTMPEGTPTTAELTKSITIPLPTREGYTLSSWQYSSPSQGSQSLNTLYGATFRSGVTQVAETVTFYASWTANKYYVRLDANGGTLCDISSGEALGSYWSSEFSSGTLTPLSTNSTYGPARVEGYSAGSNTWTYGSTSSYAPPNRFYIVPNTHYATSKTGYLKRDGYKFLGWSLDKNDTYARYVPGSYTTMRNLSAKDGGKVTLYAIWQKL